MEVPSQVWIAVGALVVSANVLGFGLCWFDKRAARLGQRRVPERNLLATVLVGGPFGLLLGMRQFRHKTRKGSFKLKLVAAVVVWSVLVGLATWALFESRP